MKSSCVLKLFVLGFALLFFPVTSMAQHYQQTNLVSDLSGMAPITDPNLVNPWGLTRPPGGPW
ncbi:MAG: TIGR03118 family protein, partial [Blastocatellia bacterium]